MLCSFPSGRYRPPALAAEQRGNPKGASRRGDHDPHHAPLDATLRVWLYGPRWPALRQHCRPILQHRTSYTWIRAWPMNSASQGSATTSPRFVTARSTSAGSFLVDPVVRSELSIVACRLRATPCRPAPPNMTAAATPAHRFAICDAPSRMRPASTGIVTIAVRDTTTNTMLTMKLADLAASAAARVPEFSFPQQCDDGEASTTAHNRNSWLWSM